MVAWDITHDYIDSGKEGTKVRTSWPATMIVLDYRFKLLDDDGNVYYRGRCNDDAWPDLLDWGMWYAGCTQVWGRKGNDKYELIIG